ncbi:MAG: hypothetical protein LBT09_02145 [Planctomycetaceae bacterium]|nr:hypothetical protein [Planctomycetaceae bacterium]
MKLLKNILVWDFCVILLFGNGGLAEGWKTRIITRLFDSCWKKVAVKKSYIGAWRSLV